MAALAPLKHRGKDDNLASEVLRPPSPPMTPQKSAPPRMFAEERLHWARNMLKVWPDQAVLRVILLRYLVNTMLGVILLLYLLVLLQRRQWVMRCEVGGEGEDVSLMQRTSSNSPMLKGWMRNGCSCWCSRSLSPRLYYCGVFGMFFKHELVENVLFLLKLGVLLQYKDVEMFFARCWTKCGMSVWVCFEMLRWTRTVFRFGYMVVYVLVGLAGVNYLGRRRMVLGCLLTFLPVMFDRDLVRHDVKMVVQKLRDVLLMVSRMCRVTSERGVGFS
ncbi:hypothetical protein AK812_SmicGene18842 [Symbiodinium microadriaticum]|uniref:Uncharacterized protein n=1 Tax=Symbiodinium microadriaticum TaxID=2951 RepID=A0A1Q9DU22_SYMMI|nr:hypothetical protein AK812_SmicGene18842 [Symbiodinium microadriaticum]